VEQSIFAPQLGIERQEKVGTMTKKPVLTRHLCDSEYLALRVGLKVGMEAMRTALPVRTHNSVRRLPFERFNCGLSTGRSKRQCWSNRQAREFVCSSGRETMKPLFHVAIYVNRKPSSLKDAAHGDEPSELLTENKAWKSGVELFQEASGQAVNCL